VLAVVDFQNHSADALFESWQRLCALRIAADEYVEHVRSHYETETNSTDRDLWWQLLEAVWPHYQVLSAWTEVAYAAYIFKANGQVSGFMTGTLPPLPCGPSRSSDKGRH
jgi:hypothetical protein